MDKGSEMYSGIIEKYKEICLLDTSFVEDQESCVENYQSKFEELMRDMLESNWVKAILFLTREKEKLNNEINRNPSSRGHAYNLACENLNICLNDKLHLMRIIFN